MNHSPDKDTNAIRSDIEETRRRMDNTMDALGDRMQPRHLLDEVLGFLRGSNDGDGEDRLTQVREKVSQSATTAMHSVVDAVKENPMPALLIGAGVAWMIYESRRPKSNGSGDGSYYGFDREGDPLRYDPNTHYDRPLQYPSGYTESEGGAEHPSKLGELKDKVSETAGAAAEQVKEKFSQAGDAVREKAGDLRQRAGEKFDAAKQRAGEMASRAKQGTRAAYTKTRDTVVDTADRHPLEVGLAALAGGLIAGLLLPTPNAVNRTVGPTADRLRHRARAAGSEMLQKGKRVAETAVSAVKEEAEAQGLTPDRLRAQANAIGEHGKTTTETAARQEGLALESPPTATP